MSNPPVGELHQRQLATRAHAQRSRTANATGRARLNLSQRSAAPLENRFTC